MTNLAILIVLTAVGCYALLSKRIKGSILTLPLLFSGLGYILGKSGLNWIPVVVGNEAVHFIAEITLILLLFTDASTIKPHMLMRNSGIPARMLFIGMPLVILFGMVVAKLVLPDQPWSMALLIAAILAPTDAALAQSVVTGEAVPSRIRQSIMVESGLNDGLALPVVIFAAILAAQATGVEGRDVPDNIALFSLLQVTLGPLAGMGIGFVGAKLLDLATERRSITTVAQGLYFLSIALVTYFGAEAIGGNGFIAAFAGGLVFGITLRAPADFMHEFMEGEGKLLVLLTFTIFGAVLAPIGFEHANWRTVALVILFLTAVRIIPIWLSLIGTGLGAYEKFFMGWFGPRGLASILFALLVLDRFPIPGADEIVACVVLAVIFSIVLHGLSSSPMSNRFASRK